MPTDNKKETGEQNRAKLLMDLIKSNPYLKGAAKSAEEQGFQDFLDSAKQQGGLASMEKFNQILQQQMAEQLPNQEGSIDIQQPKSMFSRENVSQEPNGKINYQQPGFISRVGSNVLGTQTSPLDVLKTITGAKQDALSEKKVRLSEERLNLEKQMEERRTGAEKRRANESVRTTIYSSGAELTDADLEDPDIAGVVKPLIKQNNIEPIIDPDTGMTIYSIPPKSVLEKSRKDVAAINLKKKELSKELSDYFAVGDSLPTQEGLGRFEQGAKLYAGSIFQTDKEGALAAQLNGLNKRLRVKLVRAAGDVGNLNIVEQDAAEKLLYNFSDSTDLRKLKRSFLMDLSRALDNDSPSEIKKVVSNWNKQQGEGKSVQSILPPDKAKRLEELRRKKAEGTLGR